MFELKDVKIDDRLVIDHVTIPEGKVTCIVGESGSGKTTLLKLLNGMSSPSSGEILYKGAAISQINLVHLRRQVVMAPQEPAIFEGDIKENLLIGLQFAEKPPVSEGVLHQALEAVQLHVPLDQDAGVLSGGEKQRLGLARVLLLEPQVLLMDEPTSALDEATAESIMRRILNKGRDGEASESKRTVVMISHSSSLVKEFAEHIIKVEQGRAYSHSVREGLA